MPIPELGRTPLRTLNVGRDGTLWIGSHGYGVYRYRPTTGELTHFAYRENDPSGLSYPVVHAIAEDRHGHVWFGTGDGLDMLDPATGRLRHFRHSNADPRQPARQSRARVAPGPRRHALGRHARRAEPRGRRHRTAAIHFAHPLAEHAQQQPGAGGVRDRRIAGRPPVAGHAGRHHPLRHPATNARAATASPTACRTWSSTAARSRSSATAGSCSVACAGSTCSIPGACRSPATRAAAPAVGAWVRQPGQGRSARRCGRRPSWSWPTATACCACASARWISRRPPASATATAWTASTRTGSTTAPQQDITYTRLPPGHYTFLAQATNRDGVWNEQHAADSRCTSRRRCGGIRW